MLSFITLALIFGSNIYWMIVQNYPPTLEQINLTISNPFTLWSSRLFFLIIFLVMIIKISHFFNRQLRKLFIISIFLVPAVWNWIMSYPTVIIRITFLSICSYFIFKHRSKIIPFFLSLVLIYLFNVIYLKSNPKIIDVANLNANQKEVINRINIEDSITLKNDLPLIIRRIGYNKYFFSLKNSAILSLNFLNFESLFFAEVHPQNQKGFVIFSWPMIWLFILGLFLVIKKQFIFKSFFIIFLILTFFSYLFSDLSPEHYLAPTIIPIAAVLTYTLSFLYTRFKPLAILVGLIILYSFYNNLSDRLSRPEYWLDNRPIVYQFWFNYLHNNSSLLSEKIVISNVFGPTDKYCRYFLKDCRQIQFRNFDLSQEKPANNTLYLGFNGNFFGKQFKNNFSKTVESDLLFQGFTILESKSIPDDIAFGYGNNLFITQYHDKTIK